jgi:hypothetical protein
MFRLAFSLVILLAAAPALPAFAQSNASAAAEQEACMRDLRASLKAGQKMTGQQRMVAEEQCRARAEAASQTKKK